MATYRQFQISFWQDEQVMDLTPEEKYFYIYLMTNSKTTQCGIYRIAKRLMEMETGYNRETVDKLLERFISNGKIAYCEDAKEIMILDWIKYNFINSKNTIACINKELKEVKNKTFLNIFYEECKNEEYPLEDIFKGINNLKQENQKEEELIERSDNYSPLEAPCKPLGEEEEKEKQKEEAEEKEDSFEVTFGDVIKAFSSNLHLPSPMEVDKIKGWCEDLEPAVVMLAIKEAVNYNVRNIKYINQVLNSWLSLNLKTEEAVKSYQKQHSEKNKKDNKTPSVSNAGAYRYL